VTEGSRGKLLSPMIRVRMCCPSESEAKISSAMNGYPVAVNSSKRLSMKQKNR